VFLYKVGTSSERYGVLEYHCIKLAFLCLYCNPSIPCSRYIVQPEANRLQPLYSTMEASPKALGGRQEQDRSLRIVTIVSMVPALALLIPSGVLSGNAFPALTLIPMGMSCLVSMTALGRKKDDSYIKHALPGADFASASFLMVMMVLRYVCRIIAIERTSSVSSNTKS